MLHLLTGGARSGKSSLAVRAAAESGLPVVFVATAESGRDPEFTARIARHRSERPPGWHVVEEPLALPHAIEQAPADAFVLVDCLSLWVANLCERGDGEEEIMSAAREAAASAARRSGPVIAVTNEVGLGIVPAHPRARSYRDVLGRVNAAWAQAARSAFLVVAGRTVRLEPWEGTGG